MSDLPYETAADLALLRLALDKSNISTFGRAVVLDYETWQDSGYAGCKELLGFRIIWRRTTTTEIYTV